MLLHKGDQINNVQLITGVRIVEMSQLQNCSVIYTQRIEVIVKIKIEKSQGGGVRRDMYKEWRGGGEGKMQTKK